MALSAATVCRGRSSVVVDNFALLWNTPPKPRGGTFGYKVAVTAMKTGVGEPLIV